MTPPQRRRRSLTKLRGLLALFITCAGLLALDPVQRLVVSPAARLRPSSRLRLLTAWQKFLAWWVTKWLRSVGGATLPHPVEIPGEPGTLILMNHQSVVDIPMVVQAVRGSFPRIVTRTRYERWIPLISHMVRLYQYPVVNPRANSAESRKYLAALRDAARNSEVPLALFPEGTRTRDGEIGPFKTTGLRLVLKQRRWKVYVMVADGFWERARLRDMLEGMSSIHGKLTLVGPLDWDDPRGDVEAFAEEVRSLMVEQLAAFRQTAPA